MRQLYAHSYQSLVWNRVASRRVRELGIDEDNKAQVGDLYFSQCPLISKGKLLILRMFFQSKCAVNRATGQTYCRSMLDYKQIIIPIIVAKMTKPVSKGLGFFMEH